MEFADCIRIGYSYDQLCINYLGLWAERNCFRHNVTDDLLFFADDPFPLYSRNTYGPLG